MISKIDNEDGGFKPQAFKSSRSSTQNKMNKEQMHEKAMFGPSSSSKASNDLTEPVSDQYKLTILTAPSEVNVVSAGSKSIMHENVSWS